MIFFLLVIFGRSCEIFQIYFPIENDKSNLLQGCQSHRVGIYFEKCGCPHHCLQISFSVKQSAQRSFYVPCNCRRQDVIEVKSHTGSHWSLLTLLRGDDLFSSQSNGPSIQPIFTALILKRESDYGHSIFNEINKQNTSQRVNQG